MERRASSSGVFGRVGALVALLSACALVSCGGSGSAGKSGSGGAAGGGIGGAGPFGGFNDVANDSLYKDTYSYKASVEYRDVDGNGVPDIIVTPVERRQVGSKYLKEKQVINF
jgi:hypothetical protein